MYNFDQYENLRQINQGGTATVWRATDVESGETVALKILLEKLRDSSDSRRAFFKEGAIMMPFDHPNVMRVLHVIDGEVPCLVMNYFPSENLKTLYHRQPELVEKYRMSIAQQIAKGLLYVHEQQIVHKDVKPENVLVNENGQIKLIDFSLAEQRKWYNRFNLFHRVRIQGTPSYLPPEQIRKDPVDFRADVYSLGVTYYELFTRRLPFVGKSQDEVLTKHLRERAVEPYRVAPGMDPLLSGLIMSMLEKKPENRPADMRQVLSVLNKARDTQGAKSNA